MVAQLPQYRKWCLAFCLLLSLLDANNGVVDGFANHYATTVTVGLASSRSPLGRWSSRHAPTSVPPFLPSALPFSVLATSQSSHALSLLLERLKVVVLTPLPNGVRAASTLLVSAGLGYWSEQRLWPNSGIVVTLATAAVASNVALYAPSNHILYDMCWSTVVPMSLALLIMSLPTPDNNNPDNLKPPSSVPSSSIPTAVNRLALPFTLASIGSILGCLLSWAVCVRFPRMCLPPRDALLAAACLTASFIGGSVNFFATASFIHNWTKSSVASCNFSATLLSAMAAADVVIMALYFAFLSVAVQSQRLQQWFNTANETLTNDTPKDTGTARDECQCHETNKVTNDRNVLEHCTGHALVGILAFGIVQLAQRCERMLNPFVPGTACAFVVAISLALSQWMQPKNHPIWIVMQHCAGPLSGFTFMLLFASIGVSADVSAALIHGPACFCFSLLALTVHSVVTLFGSLLAQRVMTKAHKPWVRLRLVEVLVASNAAIGGPATAAAFCSQLPSETPWKRSLTVAATVWGVTGYAIGTTIGVSLYRALSSMTSS